MIYSSAVALTPDFLVNDSLMFDGDLSFNQYRAGTTTNDESAQLAMSERVKSATSPGLTASQTVTESEADTGR